MTDKNTTNKQITGEGGGDGGDSSDDDDNNDDNNEATGDCGCGGGAQRCTWLQNHAPKT